MSNIIDNRVVELDFNNSKFEKNASTSLDTLGKLNSMLNKADSSGALSGLDDSVRKLDMSGLAGSVETIAGKFTTLGIIGVTALENITNKAVNAGTALVKSLSIDQVTSGWAKFGDKTSSVATILNSAQKAGTDEAYSLAEINDQLDKLNWFTDETSYNFVDMVNNIGKFTAQGQSLETANVAMQGIANWAAVSGQNAASASRAMYNMAQALGVGSVKLMDWKSIENANMATREFKETAIETAIALGTLEKTTDGVKTATKGTEVSVQNFSSTLSEAWFTSEVLMATLEKYGSFGDKLADVTSELDVRATDFLNGIEEFQNGPESEGFTRWLRETGLSANEVIPYMEELTKQEYQLGLKSFKAAQEAKTFRDAIDAIKDGVSTSWMNVFETIFGNYEESKRLWTNLANEGYDIFAEPINKLDEWLGRIKRNGGFDSLIEGFQNIKRFAEEIVTPIKTVFFEVFPNAFQLTSGQASLLLWRFKELTKEFHVSEDVAGHLRTIFYGLFAVIKFVGDAVGSAIKAVQPLASHFMGLGHALLEAGSYLADWVTGITESSTELTLLERAVNAVGKLIDWLSDKINNFSISESFASVFDFIKDRFNDLINVFQKVKDAIGPIDLSKLLLGVGGAGLGIGIGKFFDNISSPFKGIKNLLSNVSDAFGSLGEALSGLTGKVKPTSLKEIAISIGVLAASLLVFSSLDNAAIKQGLVALGEVTGLATLMVGAITLIAGLSKKVQSTKILSISAALISVAAAMAIMATAMLILAGAVAAFALVAKMDTLAEGLIAMAVAIAEVSLALGLLSKLADPVGLLAASVSILAVSAAMIVLAGAVAIFAAVATMDGFVTGLVGMAAGLAAISLALGLLSTYCDPLSLVASSAAILVVSAALLVFAAALGVMALIPTDKLNAAIIAFAEFLVVAGIAVGVLSGLGPTSLVASAALLAISAAFLVAAAAFGVAAIAMNIIVPAINSLAGTPLGSIALGMAEFSASMLLMTAVGAIAGAVSPLLVAFASALKTLSSAFMVFTPAIKSAESVNFGNVGNGLLKLSAGFAALAGATAILTPLAPALMLITPSLQKLGDACAQVGTGAAAFGSAMKTINDLGLSFVGIAPQVASAGQTMVTGLVSALQGAAPQLIACGSQFVNSIVTGMNASTGTFLSTARSLVNKGISAVRENSAGWSSAGKQMITNVNSGFNSAVSTFVSSARSAGNQGIAALNTGFSAGTSTFVETVGSAMSQAISNARQYYQSFVEVGQYMASGIAVGIRSRAQAIADEAASTVRNAIDAAKAEAEIASPSKKMIEVGMFMSLGLAKGISDYAGTVDKASQKMVENSLATTRLLSEQIAEAMEQDAEFTITPVLDLSDVESKSGEIAGILNSNAVLSASTAEITTSRISKSLAKEPENYMVNTGNNNPGNVYNFTQNNYSPKALNRIEIYRQTKNLVSQVKGI